jgi:hypothetical protein
MSGTEATLPKNSTEESASALESKGKGKAVVGNVHDDDVMDEDDEDDDDEEDDNEDVSCYTDFTFSVPLANKTF